MTNNIQLSTLLELRDVKVTVVVDIFFGKYMGTISKCKCNFLPMCPFAIDGCKISIAKNPIQTGIAVLTPIYPNKKITKRNVVKSHCQIFEQKYVTNFPPTTKG